MKYWRIFGIVVAVVIALGLGGLGTCAVSYGASFDPMRSGAPIKEISLMIGAAEFAAAVGVLILLIRWLRK